MPAPSEPRAFAAEIGGRLVVLDLAADRYFLSREAARPGIARDPAAETWTAKGALWPEGRADALAAIGALAALWRVSRLLARAPFEALVAEVRAAPVRRATRPMSPAGLLCAYDAVRPLFPRARVCRLEAPALTLLLRRHGHGARLVFGARLEPFAAHCWAELDGLVLNEAAEAVSQFRPLLAV